MIFILTVIHRLVTSISNKSLLESQELEVQISDPYVPIQSYLVQIFALILRSHFEELLQNFELKMIGGATKDHQLTPLSRAICGKL
jgi:hypothetical protein